MKTYVAALLCVCWMGASVCRAGEDKPAEKAKPPTRQDVDTWLRDLSSGDASARERAAKALGRFGVRRAVLPLLALLKGASVPVRCAAAEALGRIGDPRAVVPVRALADRTTGQARRRLLRAVTAWGAGDRDVDRRVLKGLSAKKPAKVQFTETPLIDVLAFLRTASGLGMWIDWRSLRAAGVAPDTAITLTASDKPVEELLWAVLLLLDKKAKACCFVRRGVVTIAAARAMAEILAIDERDRAARAKVDIAPNVARKLASRLPRCEFVDIELHDAIDFLSMLTGPKLQVDWAALAARRVDKTTIVNLCLVNASWETVLQLTLWDAAGVGTLTYRVEGDKVLVTAARAKNGGGTKARN